MERAERAVGHECGSHEGTGDGHEQPSAVVCGQRLQLLLDARSRLLPHLHTRVRVQAATRALEQLGHQGRVEPVDSRRQLQRAHVGVQPPVPHVVQGTGRGGEACCDMCTLVVTCVTCVHLLRLVYTRAIDVLLFIRLWLYVH